MNAKQVAENLRKYLKNKYPNITFSITMDGYRGVSISLMSAPFDPYLPSSERKDYKGGSINEYHFKQDKNTYTKELIDLFTDIDNFTGVGISYHETGDYGTQPSLYRWYKIGKWDKAFEIKEPTKVSKERPERPTAESKTSVDKYEIIKSKHTKTNRDIWIVKLKEKVDKDTFNDIRNDLKSKHKAYYSSFVGGFVFDFDPTDKLGGEKSEERKIVDKLEVQIEQDKERVQKQNEELLEKYKPIENKEEVIEQKEDWQYKFDELKGKRIVIGSGIYEREGVVIDVEHLKGDKINNTGTFLYFLEDKENVSEKIKVNKYDVNKFVANIVVPNEQIEKPMPIGDYRFGMMYDPNFPQEDMLKTGEVAQIEWGVDVLSDLFNSFEDMNYHSASKPLWECISLLKENRTQEAINKLNEFKDVCREELKEFQSQDVVEQPTDSGVGETYEEERERQIASGDITPETEGISIGAMAKKIADDKGRYVVYGEYEDGTYKIFGYKDTTSQAKSMLTRLENDGKLEGFEGYGFKDTKDSFYIDIAKHQRAESIGEWKELLKTDRDDYSYVVTYNSEQKKINVNYFHKKSASKNSIVFSYDELATANIDEWLFDLINIRMLAKERGWNIKKKEQKQSVSFTDSFIKNVQNKVPNAQFVDNTKIDTIELSQFLGKGFTPSLSVKAFSGDDKLYFLQYQPYGGNSIGSPDVKTYKRNVEVWGYLKDLGFKWNSYNAGKYGTAYILEKDGMAITQKGFDYANEVAPTNEKIEQLQGGEADGKGLIEIAKKHGVSVGMLTSELKAGMSIEREHTDDPKKAREIALDHLFESPYYYRELAKMEDKLSELELVNAQIQELEMLISISIDASEKAELEAELSGLKFLSSTMQEEKDNKDFGTAMSNAIFENAIIEYNDGGELDDSTHIQSILVSKKAYDLLEAIQWMKDHNKKHSVDISLSYYRFRQEDPDKFDEDTFKTIDLTKGIKAIIGKYKN